MGVYVGVREREFVSLCGEEGCERGTVLLCFFLFFFFSSFFLSGLYDLLGIYCQVPIFHNTFSGTLAGENISFQFNTVVTCHIAA